MLSHASVWGGKLGAPVLVPGQALPFLCLDCHIIADGDLLTNLVSTPVRGLILIECMESGGEGGVGNFCWLSARLPVTTDVSTMWLLPTHA